MKYLIIYLEIEHMLNFLSQSEKGDFLDLMIVYAKNQEDPVIENKNVLNVFNFIRGRLDVQFDKARIKAEVARKNGVTGGRPAIKKKPKPNPKKPKETQLVIPEFINKETWSDFAGFRAEKKKPLSDRSIKLLLKDLQIFENKKKGFANLALENSIKNSWLGLFEPKQEEYSSGNKTPTQSNTNEALTLFINNFIGHTLIKSITVSSSNKAVLQFTNKPCFDLFVKMEDELKNQAKKKISDELGTNGFEPKY